MASIDQRPGGRENGRSEPGRSNCPIEGQFDPAEFHRFLVEEALALHQKLNGRLSRDQSRDDRIDRFIRSSAATFRAVDGTVAAKHAPGIPAAATRLLLCFERLCHRTGIFLHDEGRVELVYQHLVNELLRNVRFYNFAPKHMVTATVMSSTPLTELPGAAFATEPGELRRLFYRAFTASSQSVSQFFARGQRRLDELSVTLREQSREMPRSLQVHYAFFRVKDSPKDLVEQHFALVDAICSEERFAAVPRSLVNVVVGHTKVDSAREEIERIVRESRQLLQDPEIRAVFGKRRAHVVYAVQGHPTGAREYLLRAASAEERLTELYTKLNLAFSPKRLRDLCVKNPVGARELERELRTKIESTSKASRDDDTLPSWML
jgi:hypothetical protein